MSERIRIADLARPVLTDSQRAAIAAAERIPVTLSEDAVLAAARQTTGLDDFGAGDFRARLRVWLTAADEDATPARRSLAVRERVRYRQPPGSRTCWRHPRSATSAPRPIIVGPAALGHDYPGT